MKRHLKVFVLLMISLFVLMSGVDATLDHLAHAPSQNAFASYNQKGQVVVAYSGDLNGCKAYTRLGNPASANALPRSSSYRWF
jgi:hypothetical protein